MEISIIWAGVVVFVALLIKHEVTAKRAAIEQRYDDKLKALGRALDSIRTGEEGLIKALNLANNDFKLMNERLTKLERQVNDAAVAKTLGRR
jgi:hypothetical protein